MILKLLSHFNQVHLASTREEIEAICRFRHTVYIGELRWQVSEDAEAKMIVDEDDFLNTAYHFYVGSIDDLKGCVRIRVWPQGEMPEHEQHAFAWDMFPNKAELIASEIGRFIINPDQRGSLVMPAMARRVYDFLAGEKNADLSFCYCRPGLVNLYLRLGARSYGAPLVDSPVGMLVPLVSVLSDRKFYRKMKSPLYELVNDHFGSGKRDPVNKQPFEHLFSEEVVPVTHDPREVIEAMTNVPIIKENVGFLDGLDAGAIQTMSTSGMIVGVRTGDQVILQGRIEREMYIVLEGDLEVHSGKTVISRIGPGEIFGEIAFFRGDGERTASVRAISDGKLLVLRKNFLESLKKKHPDVVYTLLMRLGAIMARRVADVTTQLRSSL